MPDIKVLRIVIKGDTTSLDTAEKKVGAFGGNVQRVAGAMKATGAALTAGITMPLLGAAAASVKTAAQFDQSLRNIDSIAHLTDSAFADLRKSVLGLANDPKIRQAPNDLAEGLYDVYSSGFKGSQALDILKVSAYGASAGMSTTSVSSKALMAVLNSGIKGFKTSQQAMDVLFQEVNLGVNTFDELARSIGPVLPSASKLGMTLQDVSAAMASMTLQGFSAARASTSILNMSTKILAPTGAMASAMDQLGIAYGSTALKGRTFGEWLVDAKKMMDDFAKTHDSITIGKTTFKVSGADDLIKRVFPDLRAMQGFMTISNDSAGKGFASMIKPMSEAGSTMEALTRQNKGMVAQWEIFKKEAQLTGISIAEVLMPPLSQLLGVVKTGVESFRAMPEPLQKIGIYVGIVAAAIGPLLLGLGNLIQLVGTLSSAWPAVVALFEGASGAFAGVAAVLTGPVGLAIAGVIALVAGLALAWQNNWGHIREVTARVVADVQGTFAAGFGWIRRWWDENLPMMLTLWNTWWGTLKAIATTLWGQLKDGWDVWGKDVIAVLGGAWDIIKAVFGGAIKIVLLTLQAGLQLLTGDWSGAWQTLIKILQAAWDTIKGVFFGAVKMVGGAVTAIAKVIIDAIIGLPGRMYTLGKNIVDGFVDGITGGKGRVQAASQDMAQVATNTAKETLQIHSPSRVFYELGMNVATGFANGMLAGGHNITIMAGVMFQRLIDESKKQHELWNDAMRPFRKQLVELMHGENSPEALLFEHPELGDLGATKLSQSIARIQIAIEKLKGLGMPEMLREHAAALQAALAELQGITLPGVSALPLADIADLPGKIQGHLPKTGLLDTLLPEDPIHQRLEQLRGYFRMTFASIFQDTLERGGNLFDGLLDGFKAMLRKMVAQYVTSQLFGAALGGGPGPLGSLLGSIFGGFRAEGGPVHTGRAYVVGERGPELFMPSGSGRIIPNGAGGGATVNFHLHGDLNNLGGLQELGDELTRAVQSGLRYRTG